MNIESKHPRGVSGIIYFLSESVGANRVSAGANLIKLECCTPHMSGKIDLIVSTGEFLYDLDT